VEILVVGGLAGMVTGVLRPDRTTGDCDVADCSPPEALPEIERVALEVAGPLGLSPEWFSSRVRDLNVLPDGWRSRRRHVGNFGELRVYAAGRMDLLCMKVLSHRVPDQEDIDDMGIRPEEIEFVRRYLQMMKVPSRGVDLDEIRGAEKYLRSLEERTK